jgi:hypothetical protein
MDLPRRREDTHDKRLDDVDRTVLQQLIRKPVTLLRKQHAGV